jgi:tetratricopeptide (TPR) repeat protein
VPSYLYEAIGPSGKKIQDRVEGESLAAANTSLTALGYTDIVFLQGDITRDTRELLRTSAGLSLEESEKSPFTPAEQIANRRHRGVWRKALWAIRKNLIYIVPLLAVNFYFLINVARLNTLEWRIFEWTLIGLAWVLIRCAPTVCYQGVLSASVWKDWKQMRRFIRVLRWTHKIIKRGAPEHDLEIREAYALASEGQLAQALQKMEDVRAKYPLLKPYIFLSRLGTVYQNAGMPEKRIDCLRQAVDASPPGLPTTRLDFATALARGGRDIARAKQLLAEAKAMGKTRIDSAGVTMCEGIIAVEEKKFTEAQPLLKKAIALFSNGSTPLSDLFICEIKTYLCLACAGLGQRDEASRLWRECKPLAVARNERVMIQRCATAAGDTSVLRAQ